MDDQQQKAAEPLPPDHLLEANAEPDPPQAEVAATDWPQAAPPQPAEESGQASNPEAPHMPPVVNLSELAMPQPPSADVPLTPPAPSATPVPPKAPTASVPQNSTQKDTAKHIVLQWLSYSLWAWSIVTISTILSSSLTYFLVRKNSSDSYEWQVYFIAAMVCLVPASFFVDRAYSRREEAKKHGFAAVVMVLNAVFVFLCALGSSIAFVVGLLDSLIHTDNNDSIKVVLIASSVTAFLTYALFFRILYLEKFKSYNRWFRYVMVAVSVLALVLSIAGPFTNEIRLKNDRLIEAGLPTIADSVSTYARANKRLPNYLTDLDLRSSYQKDAATLVQKNLVEYKKESSATTPTLQTLNTITGYNSNTSYDLNLKFQLCVTYKAAKDNNTDYRDFTSDEYNGSYISTYHHDAGHQCYKLKATGY